MAIRHGVELGLGDGNGLLISCCFKCMPHFISLVNWRKVTGQSLSNPWLDVFKGRHFWRPYKSGQPVRSCTLPNALCIEESQNTMCYNPLGRSLRWDVTTERKMSEMYWFAFKLPSIRTRDVHVLYPMATQIITPVAKLLYRHRMQASNVQSPLSLHTPIWILHTIPGLFWKDDIVPLLYPVLSFDSPESPLFIMLQCQEKRK